MERLTPPRGDISHYSYVDARTGFILYSNLSLLLCFGGKHSILTLFLRVGTVLDDASGGRPSYYSIVSGAA